MALYLISYDINEKNRDEYPELWTELKRIQAVKILYSEWITIDEVKQAAHIYERLSPLIKETDRLLVQELLKDSSWDRLLISDDDFRKWLAHARG